METEETKEEIMPKSDQQIEAYLDVVRKDIKILLENKFVGNIKYQFNLKDGGITNVNCDRHKSVKLTDEIISQY